MSKPNSPSPAPQAPLVASPVHQTKVTQK